MSNLPIGIFDSGIGGLSVWKEIQTLLPNENTIYLADSKNCPYGTRTHENILELSIANTEFLLEKNCKIIVAACNTATAAAIEVLREKYDVPFIGMEPAIKPAALNTNNGKVGILATEGTFKGRLFKETSEKYAKNIDTVIQIGDNLVELVEAGKANSEEALPILKRNIQNMIEEGIDQIVLGCTHYPFFIPALKKILPNTIEIIDPSPAVALRTKQVLEELKLLSISSSAQFDFYNSGNPNAMQNILTDMNIYDKIKSV